MVFGIDALINSQLFFPDSEMAADPAEFGMAFEDQWIETSDGIRLHSWWIPAHQPKAVLLFFHGNAGNISHRLHNLRLLRGMGISPLIPDYRGYGRSGGRPDEKGFYLDARAAYMAASKRAEESKCKLVVFGRSLGGAAAVSVGGFKGVSGVILESTFTNLGDMAKSLYLVPWLDKLLGGRFDSDERIKAIRVPLLFIHGDRDQIVPMRLGRKLYDRAAGPKAFFTVAGAGHNDTVNTGGAEYLTRVADFLDGLSIRD
jgi:fermentation-respiration switch protein FrsA (DUF1100 family)